MAAGTTTAQKISEASGSANVTEGTAIETSTAFTSTSADATATISAALDSTGTSIAANKPDSFTVV